MGGWRLVGVAGGLGSNCPERALQSLNFGRQVADPSQQFHSSSQLHEEIARDLGALAGKQYLVQRRSTVGTNGQ